MNILFTICARAGSKGVKNKNIQNFCGVPLAFYTLAAYQLFCETYSAKFDNIELAINTDSKELIEQVKRTGIPFYFVERKENLAGDKVAKIDVIRDTLSQVENRKKGKYEYVIDLDLTSPLRTAEDIMGTLELTMNDQAADIAFSVTDSRRSPYFNMVSCKENGYFDRIISANYVCRQDVPVCYDMNASIYSYNRRYLFSHNVADRKALIWKMQDTTILDIDSTEDLDLMQLLAEYYWNKGILKEIKDRAITYE